MAMAMAMAVAVALTSPAFLSTTSMSLNHHITLKPFPSLPFNPLIFRQKKKPIPIGRVATKWNVKKIDIDDEYIFLSGGRNLTKGGVPYALKRMKQIAVIGWSSEARCEAQKLRDSLAEEDCDIVVKVALDKGSHAFAEARAAGFIQENGTLGTLEDIIPESDLVLLYLTDAPRAYNYKKVFAHMKPNSMLGLSDRIINHILLNTPSLEFPENIIVVRTCTVLHPVLPSLSLEYLVRLLKQARSACTSSSFAAHESMGVNFPENISVVIVSSKGKGPSVTQDVDGRAKDVALGCSISLDSSFPFATVLEQEYKSVILGEQGLLHLLDDITKYFFQHFIEAELRKDLAHKRAVERVAGIMKKTISTNSSVQWRGFFVGIPDNIQFFYG